MKNKKSDDQSVKVSSTEKKKSAVKEKKKSLRDEPNKKAVNRHKEKKPEKSVKSKKNKMDQDAVRHPWYYLSNEEVAATGADMLQVTYQFFDQLIADFPEFVSYEVLGHEYTGLEIREYWIKPIKIGKMRIAPPEINSLPTVLMIAGQHGQELTASINLMLTLYEMFYNPRKNDTLALLRASFHLRIIPCLNAWGVAHIRRRNSRNVDLNRNFSVGWLEAQGNKGEHALSEIESQILANWVKKYKQETLCFINLHDHSDLAISWGCASHPMTQRILLHAFQKFSVWYNKNFQDPEPERDFTWLGVPREGYSDKHISEVYEVPTLLFECPYIGHARISDQWLDIRMVSHQLLTHVFEALMTKYYQCH